MRRRFITKQDIDDLADRGALELEVGREVTVTDLAREQARARGVRIVPVGVPSRPGTPVEGATAEVPIGQVRGRVRAAIIARLGTVPDDLDRVLDRHNTW